MTRRPSIPLTLHTADLATEFGRDWATKLFGQEAIASLPTRQAGKNKGAPKGYVIWRKANGSGWCAECQSPVRAGQLVDAWIGTGAFTLRWLNQIDFTYLMGKSSAQREYDRDGTLREIIRFANEDAIHAGRAAIRGAREYRAAVIEALCQWDADETRWAVGPLDDIVDVNDRPRLADYLPDRDSFDRWGCQGFFHQEHGRGWIAPDGFEMWLRIYQHRDILFDDQGLGPNCLLFAWGRREAKDAVRDLLSDGGQETAARFCMDIGIDDYYGREEYPEHCYLWAAAIQTWVDQVIDQFVPRSAEALADA